MVARYRPIKVDFRLPEPAFVVPSYIEAPPPHKYVPRVRTAPSVNKIATSKTIDTKLWEGLDIPAFLRREPK